MRNGHNWEMPAGSRFPKRAEWRGCNGAGCCARRRSSDLPEDIMGASKCYAIRVLPARGQLPSADNRAAGQSWNRIHRSAAAWQPDERIDVTNGVESRQNEHGGRYL